MTEIVVAHIHDIKNVKMLMPSQRKWAWQPRTQGSLTRMGDWMYNSEAFRLRQQRTMSFSYRAVSSEPISVNAKPYGYP